MVATHYRKTVFLRISLFLFFLNFFERMMCSKERSEAQSEIKRARLLQVFTTPTTESMPISSGSQNQLSGSQVNPSGSQPPASGSMRPPMGSGQMGPGGPDRYSPSYFPHYYTTFPEYVISIERAKESLQGPPTPRVPPSPYLDPKVVPLTNFTYDPNNGGIYNKTSTIPQEIYNAGLFQLGLEAFGILINDIEIRSQDYGSLAKGSEFTIQDTIADSILPRDYFDHAPYALNAPNNTIVQCQYGNPGPTYSTVVFQDIAMWDLVNSDNYNYGIIGDQPGIFVLSVRTPTSSPVINPLETYLSKPDVNKDFITNSTIFTNIFVIKRVDHEKELVLVGVSKVGDIYMYDITDLDPNVNVQLTPKARILCASFVGTGIGADCKNFTNSITNVGIWTDAQKKEYFFLSTNWGSFPLIIFSKYSTTGAKPETITIPGNSKYSNLRFLDMIINRQTAYLIASEYGLVILNLNTMQFLDYEIKHPNMMKLDYVTSPGYIGTGYYIGIVVNNVPSKNIKEIFIELNADYSNELKPTINKIFTSNSDYDWSKIITDNYLGMTYMLDSITNDLVVLTRAVPNVQYVYNYHVDLDEFIIGNDTKKYEFVNIYLLSLKSTFLPSVAIERWDSGSPTDLILVNKFNIPNNTLLCSFREDDYYIFTFPSWTDCSVKTDTNNYIYQKCWNNVTFTLDVKSGGKGFNSAVAGSENNGGNLTGLWVVLGLLLSIGAVVIGLILCMKKGLCSKNKTSSGHVQYIQGSGRDKDNDMMEVHVDQKY
jgi:hypothetical protein